MTIDWDAFEEDLDSIIEEAGDKTDDRLAAKISSITRLTDDEIKVLFPEPADVKKLESLMRIVKSADARNIKIDQMVGNAEEFAGIVVTLLEKFA